MLSGVSMHWRWWGWLLLCAAGVEARDWFVAFDGDDSAPGTRSRPLRTIQRAAELAQPGDRITVRAGVYRERVNPPRGGLSNVRRIVYQAAPGERVVIKGSEVVRGWERVRGEVWRVSLPNTFFGPFNPYTNEIRGDWFDPRGRVHHTGAVYLDGHWLTEARSLEELFLPDGARPAWLIPPPTDEYLLNVAWWRPGRADRGLPRVQASAFVSQSGVQAAPCSEGGDCIGWINPGDWVRYEGVDFGEGVEELELRAAAPGTGGLVEVRLESAQGEVLGVIEVGPTGGWQLWRTFSGRLKRVSGVNNVCLVFRRAAPESALTTGLCTNLWFAEVDDRHTTLWAQFPGVDPNQRLVEINVRQTVFYPDRPGRNYITVRGFVLEQAATPWAPPTAEQIGLIGTHWSKGWIIESNIVRYSVCAGISLGKYGDEFDNTSAETAEGYVATIRRALAFRIPWSREQVGHHVVHGNIIAHCEQAGIVGSLGGAFSHIEGNLIHHIHVRRLFGGAEMAGIKLHGAIDTVIRRNHIHHCSRGLWLDWMAQGTRVTANLFHDNGPDEDLFVEVNHGPFVVDNNLFLSARALLDWSQGGAFVHNLIAGLVLAQPEPHRQTPYHPPRQTKIAGLAPIQGGDHRFYYNVLVGPGASLTVHDKTSLPMWFGGNVFLAGARPSVHEPAPVVGSDLYRRPFLEEVEGAWILDLAWDPAWIPKSRRPLVTTALLGRAAVSGAAFDAPDGSPLEIATDYWGRPRNPRNPMPGPFESLGKGMNRVRVW